jgi:hypothetical protein
VLRHASVKEAAVLRPAVRTLSKFSRITSNRRTLTSTRASASTLNASLESAFHPPDPPIVGSQLACVAVGHTMELRAHKKLATRDDQMLNMPISLISSA